MQIVADENIPLAEAFFGHLGTVVRVPGRTLQSEQLQHADMLLVRSVTPVNAELLATTPVKFVASATIGTDHVDTDWLQQRGIHFSNAPGCNADSVVDYVLSTMTSLAQQQGCQIFDRRVGIVGVGNVGRRLQQRLERLGIDCLLCDPPRAELEPELDWVGLDELIQRCDLFCLHTPLTGDGAHPTHHLFNAERLDALPQGSWLINAGRGAVVDNSALSACLGRRADLQVVLDVWEPEPAIDPCLAQQLAFSTPHIAGYSLEGKSRGTEMIYRSACRFLGVEPAHALAQLLPAPVITQIDLGLMTPGSIGLDQIAELDLIARLVKLVYDVRRDHDALMQTLSSSRSQIAVEFDRLRRYYPERREFSSLKISGVEPNTALSGLLTGYGFQLAGC